MKVAIALIPVLLAPALSAAQNADPQAAVAAHDAEMQQKMQEQRQKFDAARSAMSHLDLEGALVKFKAIAAEPGPFQQQARQEVEDIERRLASNADNASYGDALQSLDWGDLGRAFDEFKAVASHPGPLQTEAQDHIKELTAWFASTADRGKFEDALKAQDSGDLKGASAMYKALAAKLGPYQAQAIAHVKQLSQLSANPNHMGESPVGVLDGGFELDTIPAGIEVLVDGRPYGHSPVHATLPPGLHTYVVKWEGSHPTTGSFDLQKGTTKRLALNAYSHWDTHPPKTPPVVPTDGTVASGDLHYAMGQYTQAISDYQHVLKLDPSNAEARHKLEVAIESCKKENQTLRSYSKCEADSAAN